jgi:hypothetical protein
LLRIEFRALRVSWIWLFACDFVETILKHLVQAHRVVVPAWIHVVDVVVGIIWNLTVCPKVGSLFRSLLTKGKFWWPNRHQNLSQNAIGFSPCIWYLKIKLQQTLLKVFFILILLFKAILNFLVTMAQRLLATKRQSVIN